MSSSHSVLHLKAQALRICSNHFSNYLNYFLAWVVPGCAGLTAKALAGGARFGVSTTCETRRFRKLKMQAAERIEALESEHDALLLEVRVSHLGSL